MILTSQSLLGHLLERGVIDWAAVAGGGVRIAEATRRHRNFKVLRRNGPGFFVKQAQSWDPHTTFCLLREGTCSWLAQNERVFGPLRGRLPAFRDYDPSRHVLVVELFAEAEGLAEYHQRRAVYPPEIGAGIGRLLGELHAEVHITPGDGRFAPVFPGIVPPILTLHQTPPASLQAYGPAAAQVIGLVREDPGLAQALFELVRDWRRSSLIHGDVKWDNLLVGENGGGLKLIDWELADVGDPAWDAGAVFQAYLAAWLGSMPAVPVAADALAAQAGIPLERLQPAMHAFWESYCEARGIPADDRRRQRLRCLRYGAGRLIQTAFEIAAFTRQWAPQALRLVQLSRSVLTRTGEAAEALLGA